MRLLGKVNETLSFDECRKHYSCSTKERSDQKNVIFKDVKE